LRTTPSPEHNKSVPAPRLSRPSTSRQEITLVDKPSQGAASASETMQYDSPATPPGLFRATSYDQDAEDTQAQMSSFGEAEGEGDETLDDMADDAPPAFRSLEDELGPPSTAFEDDESPVHE